jgi:hypothetical protein
MPASFGLHANHAVRITAMREPTRFLAERTGRVLAVHGNDVRQLDVSWLNLSEAARTL